MKTILLFLFFYTFLMSQNSRAADLILSCSFGNQIAWSSVELTSDNRVKRSEFDVSQGFVPVVTSFVIAGYRMGVLKRLIQNAFGAKVTKSEVMTADGSRTGTVEVRQNEDRKIIAGIERHSTRLSFATEYTSSSKTVAELIGFCNEFMTIPVPGPSASLSSLPVEATIRKIYRLVNRAIETHFSGQVREIWGHEIFACEEFQSCDFYVETMVRAPLRESYQIGLQACVTPVQKVGRSWREMTTECEAVGR